MANTRFKTENGLLVTGSNSHFFADVYVGNTDYDYISNPSVGSNLYVYGDLLYVAGNLHVIGNQIITGDVEYNINIIPSQNGLDLGSPTYKFDAHLANVIIYGYLNPSSNGIPLGTTTKRWDIFANSINATGQATIEGAVNLSNTVSIGGATTIANTLNVTRSVIFSNTLAVTGNVNFSNTITITGNSNMSNTLNVTGAVTLANTLTVVGNTNIQGSLTVNRSVTFSNTLTVVGNVNFSNTLTVVGNVNISNTLIVGGNTIFNSNVTFSNNVTFNQNITLPGNVNFTNIQISNNLSIGGNLIANGSLHIINGNVNFDSATLFVDSVNGRVGVGTSTPDTKLQVSGAANVTGRIYGGSLSVAGAGNVGGLLGVQGGIDVTGTANVSSFLRVGQRSSQVNGVFVNNSTIILGNTNVYSALDESSLQIISRNEVSPGVNGLGQIRILANSYNGYIALDGTAMYVGHNSANRLLSFNINESPKLQLKANNEHTLTGNLSVSGIISGNATGLTSVNWVESYVNDNDTQIAVYNSPNVWRDGGTYTSTIPTGIDTVDIYLYAEYLVTETSVRGRSTYVQSASGGPVSVSGVNVSGSYVDGAGDTIAGSSLGGTVGGFSTGIVYTAVVQDTQGGPGNPELRYRILRNNIEIFISDWTQVSTAGAFAYTLTSVRDGNPTVGASSSYKIQYQWRSVEDRPGINTGSVTSTAGSRIIYGSGTNWAAFVGSKLQIRFGGTTYEIREVIQSNIIELETAAVGTYGGTSFTILDPAKYLQAYQNRLVMNFTGYRT